MRSIWKYEFEITAIVQSWDMPKGAAPVHVEMQGRHLCMWVDVETEAERDERTFVIIGTGREVPADAGYVGTAQHGSEVWHLFEVVP